MDVREIPLPRERMRSLVPRSSDREHCASDLNIDLNARTSFVVKELLSLTGSLAVRRSPAACDFIPFRSAPSARGLLRLIE